MNQTIKTSDTEFKIDQKEISSEDTELERATSTISVT